MYAIVDIAGQQFKVEAGNEIFVQRLADAKGADVEFKKVLLVADDAAVKVGAPYVEGAVVKATVLDDEVKADKVLVFKKIRRKGFQKLNGHRQKLTKIKINEIAKELWHTRKVNPVPRTVVSRRASAWVSRNSAAKS